MGAFLSNLGLLLSKTPPRLKFHKINLQTIQSREKAEKPSPQSLRKQISFTESENNEEVTLNSRETIFL